MVSPAGKAEVEVEIEDPSELYRVMVIEVEAEGFIRLRVVLN